MHDLSKDAEMLVCTMFWSGERATVRSHPPHLFFKTNKNAFDELLRAGLISGRPYNDHGVIEYVGTKACHEIWRERGRKLVLGDD